LSDNKKELLENLAIATTLLTGAVQATNAIVKIIKKLTTRPKPKPRKKRRK
jgi:hypothetical protein